MRNRFDNQLAEMNNELISMGALCENAIASAVKALLEGDIKLAAAAIRIDQEIDRKEREIESMCLKLLLQQQPVASDLRLISSVLKMITDIERIGDQASDIAEIVTYLSGACGHNTHIDQMAQATIKMVTDSLHGALLNMMMWWTACLTSARATLSRRSRRTRRTASAYSMC